MKTTSQKLLAGVVLAMALGAGPALAVQPAGVFNLVGTWKNISPATANTIQVNITSDATGFKVRTFGACTPTPCDHGTVPALRYSKTVTSAIVHGLSAQYNAGFATRIVTAKRVYDIDGGAFLELETRTRFAAGDTRQDYMKTELFIKR